MNSISPTTGSQLVYSLINNEWEEEEEEGEEDEEKSASISSLQLLLEMVSLIGFTSSLSNRGRLTWRDQIMGWLWGFSLFPFIPNSFHSFPLSLFIWTHKKSFFTCFLYRSRWLAPRHIVKECTSAIVKAKSMHWTWIQIAFGGTQLPSVTHIHWPIREIVERLREEKKRKKRKRTKERRCNSTLASRHTQVHKIHRRRKKMALLLWNFVSAACFWQ